MMALGEALGREYRVHHRNADVVRWARWEYGSEAEAEYAIAAAMRMPTGRRTPGTRRGTLRRLAQSFRLLFGLDVRAQGRTQ